MELSDWRVKITKISFNLGKPLIFLKKHNWWAQRREKKVAYIKCSIKAREDIKRGKEKETEQSQLIENSLEFGRL